MVIKPNAAWKMELLFFVKIVSIMLMEEFIGRDGGWNRS
jgi:hypothetical protein